MRRKKEYFEGLVKSGNKEKRKTRKRHKEEKKYLMERIVANQ